MRIRPVEMADHDILWQILEPAIRSGETLALPRELARDAALDYWLDPDHEAFIAEPEAGDGSNDARACGAFYLRANARGGGGHVANCGYVTAPWAMGRGVARAMCLFSFERARARGFAAMQFNLVVATNAAAVHLWRSCGMEIVGRLPGVFFSPTRGYVDALVMHRHL